jgi:hypothetical protein
MITAEDAPLATGNRYPNSAARQDEDRYGNQAKLGEVPKSEDEIAEKT